MDKDEFFIQFCRACGNPVNHVIPPEDTRVRAVCPTCGTIHYQNPLSVVGTIPFWEDQVLLCQRNIEPRKGFWTLPAGFMELGETTQEGALRETHEEAGINVELSSLFTMINVPHVSQVHFFYLARMLSPVSSPGAETLEARLFKASDIPWNDLAFLTVKETLERFFSDFDQGHFQFHHFNLTRPANVASIHSSI